MAHTEDGQAMGTNGRQSRKNPFEYWTNRQMDERNARIRIAPSRRREILADVAKMEKPIDVFHYEQSLRSQAKSDLIDAVIADIHRRDDLGEDGWEDAKESKPSVQCDGISSFRLGHASLIGLIGYDYDGCADPVSKTGNPKALASLARELSEMAALAYANVPSRYYPLDMGDGVWTVKDVMTRVRQGEHRGRIVVPLASLMLDDEADGEDTRETRELLASEWWGMFLSSRSREIAEGMLVPLPAACPSKADGEGDLVGMDGGVMLSCANVLRHWESVRDSVPGLVEAGDTRALCDIVDVIVGHIDSDVTMTGWHEHPE